MNKRQKRIEERENRIWGVEHAGIILDKVFKTADEAWKWALWNYKGREGWRLRIVQ